MLVYQRVSTLDLSPMAKKKRQGKSMHFFNVWYFGELPQSAETQNYTGCHRVWSKVHKYCWLHGGYNTWVSVFRWQKQQTWKMIWRFPKMGVPRNHPWYFRIFHYEPAIGDPPCLYMKFHGLPVADARRFWLNLGIDTVVKWYTEPWTDGGVSLT